MSDNKCNGHMLNEALKYLSLGLSVIPLKPKSKEPLIKWQEYQKRFASIAEVSQWWVQNPTANIGVVTGVVSGVAVVDLDGPEGLASAASLGLKSSVVSLTGNGRHLWYRYTANSTIGNAVRIAPGIDIRGEGGFVVAPPSIAQNGRRYRWLNAFNVNQLTSFPALFSAAETPVSKTGLIKEESWIAKALQDMQTGKRHEVLLSVCGRLRYDGYSAEDTTELLRLHCEKLGAVDILDETIENVWSRYEAKKVSVTVDNEEAESVDAFLETDEKVEWVAPGIIAKNSIVFVCGLPESNKTWLTMDLAVEASLGGNWLGLFPVGRTKTLFIDQERFRGETKRRFKSILKDKGLDNLDGLYIKCGSSIKIDLDRSYDGFVRLLEKIRPELVIIDSLATFHSKEENSRSEIQSVMERVKQLREQFKCTFLFICHSNKFAFQAAQEGKEPGMAEMAGSIALPAAAETVLTVQKAKGGGSTVFHTKSTLGPKMGTFGVMVEDTDKGIMVRGIK